MTAQPHDRVHDDLDDAPPALSVAPDAIEVRRNAALLGVVGALAAGVSVAWVARAATSNAPLDWLIAVVVGVIALFHLVGCLDARTPLLVADGQGVRLRRGRLWRGLPWSALDTVEVAPAPNPLRDGRLTVVPHNVDRVLADFGHTASGWRGRLASDPLSVPLGLATRVVGNDDALADSLAVLAGTATDVVEIVAPEADAEEMLDDPGDTIPAPESAEEGGRWDAVARLRDPRPILAAGITHLADRLPLRRGGDAPAPDRVDAPALPPLVASAQPMPARDSRPAVRADLDLPDRTLGAAALRLDPIEEESRWVLPEARELHRPGSVSLVEDDEVWGDRVQDVSPIARAGEPVAPLVIEDDAPEPALDPVIGPEIAAARTRLGLTVDQLAERTRIRPHVLESIEVDDFTPCGGDFYARGHLRTLARVLGIDAAPLLESYADRYAHAPVSPRRVFEAELAGSGSVRATRGGLNWSLLVAVIMALVLAWSVARLVMDSPVELKQVPGLGQGSGGLRPGATTGGAQVPVLLQAAGGGAHVVVRNGDGEVVFTGDLSYGSTRNLKVVPPVRVESSDGGVEVVVDGVDKGRLGEPGQPASATFIGR